MSFEIKKGNSFDNCVREFAPYIQEKFGKSFEVTRIIIEEADMEFMSYVLDVSYYSGTIKEKGKISIRNSVAVPCQGPYSIDHKITPAGDRMLRDLGDYGELMGKVFMDL